MRLRIAHQLSILIVSSVVLAVLAVGALSLWNLRSGFSDYLRLRDDEQLTRLVTLIEAHAAADTSMEWLRDDREAMRALMDELQGREPRPGRAGNPPPPGMDRDRPPPLPRPPPPGNFPQRVLIRDVQGDRLAGVEGSRNARRTVRAVKVEGVTLATVELAAEQQPEGVDARFLQRQTTGLAGAALATVLIALLAGWWVAGRWSRPLRELQRATQRIANGELAVQIPVGNAPGASRSGAIEIESLITDVNAMSLALGALEAARRTWVAEISHELRTPLAVLRGELEAIEDGARQPSPQVILNLREEVMQLTRLVDDLHTLAVSDMGQMPCEFSSGDVREALLRMVRRFEGRAAQLGIRLDIGAVDGPPVEANWDFGRIEQLMSNLLENSLRYTDAPGRILVRWEANGPLMTLTVEDSAPGVPAGQRDQLFEPLFRADKARTRTGQYGSGLGLSIVRAIARAHRGSAQVLASELGGIAVRIELPLQPQRLDRRRER